MGYAVFLLCAAVIAPALASDAPTAPANPDESVDRTLVCPYCETARGPDEFCARCGRLATATTAPSSRFWGDAPYVLGFPAVGMTPSITAEIGTMGSPEVQVAILTSRINTLTGHLRANTHDESSRRGLLMLIGQRRRLLAYIRRTDYARYMALTDRLGIRRK